jgi:hypothetical protein
MKERSSHFRDDSPMLGSKRGHRFARGFATIGATGERSSRPTRNGAIAPETISRWAGTEGRTDSPPTVT